MGYIKDIANQPKLQTFPSSQYAIAGDVPKFQCRESQITFVNAVIFAGQTLILRVGAFAAIDLTGKKVTVTAPAPDVGLYNVLSNTNDRLFTDHTFIGAGPACAASVHDTGQLFLTRNLPSFQRYIESQARSHTTKGGILYTNTPTVEMQNACSLAFNPLT